MNKKIISAVMALTLALGMACTTAFADDIKAKEVIDLNNDGKCSVQDMLTVATAIKIGKGEADINGDGKTNISDLLDLADVINEMNNSVVIYKGENPILGTVDRQLILTDNELEAQLLDWYEDFKKEGREPIDFIDDYEVAKGGYNYGVHFTDKSGNRVKLYQNYVRKWATGEEFNAITVNNKMYIATDEEADILSTLLSL